MSGMEPEAYVSAVEKRLKEYVPEETLTQADLFRSMRYSLLAGGKRIRPVILLEFCRLCGGNTEAALPFACAVEMIHTYSLIHDDLPCMDNDDMRRGKPSNHMVFGEAQALLAGDALLTMAFETMLSPESVGAVGADRAAKAAGELARAAGAYGMVGGQVIDLQSEGKTVTADTLIRMDECKTGALICAAAKMGCILAGADKTQIDAAGSYAKAIGLAFQIRDDILDETADSEQIGKPAGSDRENEKSTYVTFMGLKKAQETVEELTQSAVAALSVFGKGTEALSAIAARLAQRKK